MNQNLGVNRGNVVKLTRNNQQYHTAVVREEGEAEGLSKVFPGLGQGAENLFVS